VVATLLYLLKQCLLSRIARDLLIPTILGTLNQGKMQIKRKKQEGRSKKQEGKGKKEEGNVSSYLKLVKCFGGLNTRLSVVTWVPQSLNPT
jgi:hypothetical protein